MILCEIFGFNDKKPVSACKERATKDDKWLKNVVFGQPGG